MPFLKAAFNKGRGRQHEDSKSLGGRRRHDGLRRACAEGGSWGGWRQTCTNLTGNGFHLMLHTFSALHQFSLCKFGFPAAQMLFQCSLTAKSPVSIQRRGRGLGFHPSRQELLSSLSSNPIHVRAGADAWVAWRWECHRCRLLGCSWGWAESWVPSPRSATLSLVWQPCSPWLKTEEAVRLFLSQSWVVWETAKGAPQCRGC